MIIPRNKWKFFLYILLGYINRARCNMNSATHPSSGLYLSSTPRGREHCFILCDGGGLGKTGDVVSYLTLRTGESMQCTSDFPI